MADDLEKPIVQAASLDALDELGFGGAILAVECYRSQPCSSLDFHPTYAKSPKLVG